MAKELRERAQCCISGSDARCPAPATDLLLDKLTDELLVVASDAATAAVSGANKLLTTLREPLVSARARFRLLAWLVADARGAQEALDKADAETIGRRLDRQATRVRDNLVRAAEDARLKRDAARDSGAMDGELQAALAAIDAEEQAVVEHARSEVYVGFTELDSLMPKPLTNPLDHLERPSQEATVDSILKPDVSTNDLVTAMHKALEARGIRCPESYVTYEQDDEHMPPDLAEAVGSDAARQLQAFGSCYSGADQWWTIALPLFVRHLVSEHAATLTRIEREHDMALDAANARRVLEEGLCADWEKRYIEQAEELEAEMETVEQLRGELREAKGREEALHAVIQRCRWG